MKILHFMSFDRVADLSDEVQRLRPIRFIHTDGIIRPFRLREAEGHHILLVSLYDFG